MKKLVTSFLKNVFKYVFFYFHLNAQIEICTRYIQGLTVFYSPLTTAFIAIFYY